MSSSDDINSWLISEGRILGDAEAIVEGYSSRLVEAGVPLSRANIASRFANPLLVAWGVIWTPEGTTEYDVTHAMLDTGAYVGSPFHTVLTSGKPLHKSLIDLDEKTEHSSYLEFAENGGTDLFANFLEYGDGTKNGCTFVSNSPDGFSNEHMELIQGTRHGLASAIEPITMRKSTNSLLRTYIGDGPASAVKQGTIMRGEHAGLEAVVMFTDLRGFTAKSELWSETKLLDALNGYFDVVVQAVEEHGGDVLKFMGDGILSIFPIEDPSLFQSQCHKAVKAARIALTGLNELNHERGKSNEEPLAMGIGINVGSVTYGNIGSPARLDFTVLGTAVNVASRVQDLCKELDEPVLATEKVAKCLTSSFNSLGRHSVRGVAEPIEVFGLKPNER